MYLCRLWREIWRAQQGLALVEFGLAFPFLVLLIVAVIDLGLAFYAGLQVQGAASAGAQYASAHGFNQTNIQNVVANAGSFNGIAATPAPTEVCGCTNSGTMIEEGALPSSGTCSSYTTCTNGGGVYAKVQAKLSYSTLIRYPGLSNQITLSGLAYRRLQ